MTKSQGTSASRRTASLLSALHPAVRIDILLLLGRQERCVCHLEKALGLRQAFLSQHLMALRKAGLILRRREGRFIYYRLADPKTIGFIHKAARLAGMPLPAAGRQLKPMRQCPCPSCRKAPPGRIRQPASLAPTAKN